MDAKDQVWRVEGEYFESCSCEVLCPCLLSNMQARPSKGHCDVVLGFRIRKGSYGDVDISGLNAAQALTTPGPMADGQGTLAVYVDSRGNDAQRAALNAIFSGNVGGPPALLVSVVSTHLPTKTAAIDFNSDGRVWKLSIGNVGEVTIEGIEGANNQVVWLEGTTHPASSRLAVAKGGSCHYNDHGLVFDNTGRNGHFAPISWSNG